MTRPGIETRNPRLTTTPSIDTYKSQTIFCTRAAASASCRKMFRVQYAVSSESDSFESSQRRNRVCWRGGAYCSTKNDGISERKFRHKSPATINFMALAWPRAVARVKKGGSRATRVIKNGPFSFLGCDPGRDFGSRVDPIFPL